MSSQIQKMPPSPKGEASEPVATFQIAYSQILNEHGQLTAELPEFAKDHNELIRMYEAMTLTRTFDQKAINLQRTGKLGTYASCLGHEAAHVGIGAAMKAEDVFAPMYREYGAQFWRGVKMEDVLLYWGGDERGNNFAGPKHDFAWSVPIATQCVHAAGAAFAFKTRGEARCAVSVVGDGGTSEGAFYEAINFAGVQKLPVVFVVVNNKWAISVPLELQTAAETLAQKAIAAGMPGIQVDGNDIIAMRHIMSGALDRARRGRGPMLVEAMTYRLSDHTTADDASRYRQNEEVEAARKLEPLKRLRIYLEGVGAWNDDREKALLKSCAEKVEAAVSAYQATPKPAIESMFEHMYAEMPESLIEQRAIALEYGDDNDHG